MHAVALIASACASRFLDCNKNWFVSKSGICNSMQWQCIIELIDQFKTQLLVWKTCVIMLHAFCLNSLYNFGIFLDFLTYF